MKDPVIAQVSETHAKAVERDYAEEYDLKILPDEPLYAHGRIRGIFRIDGRPDKPRENLPQAIPTPPTDGQKADGPTPDGPAVKDTPEESK